VSRWRGPDEGLAILERSTTAAARELRGYFTIRGVMRAASVVIVGRIVAVPPYASPAHTEPTSPRAPRSFTTRRGRMLG